MPVRSLLREEAVPQRPVRLRSSIFGSGGHHNVFIGIHQALPAPDLVDSSRTFRERKEREIGGRAASNRHRLTGGQALSTISDLQAQILVRFFVIAPAQANHRFQAPAPASTRGKTAARGRRRKTARWVGENAGRFAIWVCRPLAGSPLFFSCFATAFPAAALPCVSRCVGKGEIYNYKGVWRGAGLPVGGWIDCTFVIDDGGICGVGMSWLAGQIDWGNCCGAMTHDKKSCMVRPRKLGAKWTSKHIAPDEKIETFELDYDGKRDRWNGYDPSTYARVIERYEARDEARRKYLKEQQLKKLEEKNNNQNGEGEVSDEEDDEDALKVDEAKVDESRQMDFAKVEKRVRTTGGGSTGTVRNLRIREDTAKYLLNLDVNSAHYDPKTRSMREDPLPDSDPNDKFYGGDNQYRNSGQASDFKQLNIHAWEAFEKGQDIHMQAAPSQAELLFKNYKVIKEKLKSQTKDTIMEKYGNAASEEELPKELLLGQSEREVEYDRAGRIIKGQETSLPRSKYEEDVYINNHTSVWGSWWKDHQWGYKCCKQTLRNSYCTGSAGIDAAEAASDLMKANLARKEAAEEKPVQGEERRIANWGTDVPEDLILDQKLLREALKKEDESKKEEKDERKRKYNVKWNDEVTVEDMEAYRMKKIHHEDPIKIFAH